MTSSTSRPCKMDLLMQLIQSILYQSQGQLTPTHWFTSSSESLLFMLTGMKMMISSTYKPCKMDLLMQLTQSI